MEGVVLVQVVGLLKHIFYNLTTLEVEVVGTRLTTLGALSCTDGYGKTIIHKTYTYVYCALIAILLVVPLGSAQEKVKPILVKTSWYGENFRGRITCSGETFNPDKFTVASRRVPINSILALRNPLNKRVAIVRVTDCGPYVSERSLDVTPKVADFLGFRAIGVVTLEQFNLTTETENVILDHLFPQSATHSIFELLHGKAFDARVPASCVHLSIDP